MKVVAISQPIKTYRPLFKGKIKEPPKPQVSTIYKENNYDKHSNI